MQKRILIIEPYYGGSHKQFVQGLVKHIGAEWVILHLPARKWKMRMQLSAPWFVKKIKQMERIKRHFDTVLLSTFVDVAVFRALVTQVEGWNPETTLVTYFHENQFNYPGILPKEQNHQFTAINFTTALASDKIAFNSKYNRDGFIKQCRKYIQKADEISLSEELEEVELKSHVLYPGIDYSVIDSLPSYTEHEKAPLIIWNHRWEHDKNPETFFSALYYLEEQGVAFRLAVLGQHFQTIPPAFDEARRRLKHRICHFGFIAEKRYYYDFLKKGQFIISTSNHEFFGISILEGVRAGCFPLVPNRLSYPELFDERFRYEDNDFAAILREHLLRRPCLERHEFESMTERFSWESLRSAYQQWLGITG